MGKEPCRCSYIHRSGPLHPSVKIGGGHSLGQCENECFPNLVVCFEHATKDTLAYLAKFYIKKCAKLEEELKTLKGKKQ